MTLTWNGHACFTFDTDDGVVVFDPYERDYIRGLHLPALAGDLVLCSHDHRDHGYVQGVLQTRRMTWFKVEAVETLHDDAGGTLRGKNTVHIVDTGELRLAHLGDLGHVLTEAQVAAIGKVDVLLIPIGGVYTLDAPQAKTVCDQLNPRVIVPMHFRKGEMGYEEIAEPDAFLSMFDRVTVIDGHTVELTEDLSGVVVFSAPRQE